MNQEVMKILNIYVILSFSFSMVSKTNINSANNQEIAFSFKEGISSLFHRSSRYMENPDKSNHNMSKIVLSSVQEGNITDAYLGEENNIKINGNIKDFKASSSIKDFKKSLEKNIYIKRISSDEEINTEINTNIKNYKKNNLLEIEENIIKKSIMKKSHIFIKNNNMYNEQIDAESEYSNVSDEVRIGTLPNLDREKDVNESYIRKNNLFESNDNSNVFKNIDISRIVIKEKEEKLNKNNISLSRNISSSECETSSEECITNSAIIARITKKCRICRESCVRKKNNCKYITMKVLSYIKNERQVSVSLLILFSIIAAVITVLIFANK